MSQSPARHLGHGRSGSGGQGCQDQRRGISHTARGVLVHLHPGQAGQVDLVARIHHGLGEGRKLRDRHALEPDGHQPGGHLIGLDALIVGEPQDEFANLLGGVFSTVALLEDQLIWIHPEISLTTPRTRETKRGRASAAARRTSSWVSWEGPW